MAVISDYKIGTVGTKGATGVSNVDITSIEVDLATLKDTAFSTGDSLALFDLPVNTIVLAAGMRNLTAITNVTRFDLGDTDNDDRYASNFATFTAGATSATVPANIPFRVTAAAKTFDLKVTGTVASMTGRVQIDVIYALIGGNNIPKSSVRI